MREETVLARHRGEDRFAAVDTREALEDVKRTGGSIVYMCLVAPNEEARFLANGNCSSSSYGTDCRSFSAG